MEPRQSTSTASEEPTRRRRYRKVLPTDVRNVKKILHELRIAKYDPGVVTMILEFCHRYVLCVLEDAKVFSEHAGKEDIDVEDINLSIMMQTDKGFTSGPPRDAMMEIAREKNATELPLLMQSVDINLPQDEFCVVPAEPHNEYD